MIATQSCALQPVICRNSLRRSVRIYHVYSYNLIIPNVLRRESVMTYTKVSAKFRNQKKF
jgi:hypothetical protein